LSKNNARLAGKSYSFAEPHEKLSRQSRSRRELQRLLGAELQQLSRSASYISRIRSIQDIADLILQSNEEERQRFIQYRDRLLKIAEIVALTTDILVEAANCEAIYDLKPQDALVYASVIHHLQIGQPPQSCFLNRNSKDFDTPDIVDALNQFNCRMIPKFDDGYRFLQSQLCS
jgi:hypothetical protein